MFKKVDTCRACQGPLKDVLDFGNQYVVDFVKYREGDHLVAPLVLAMCNSCNLVQLRHSVNQDRLYKKFWYRSGINESMKAALRNIVNSSMMVTELNHGDAVLDIGCNDGTLLSFYERSVRRVGVDPCRELVHEGFDKRRIDAGIVGYFNAGPNVVKFAPYKIITAIAMFYDLENPKQFLLDCKKVLHADGTLIIQMNYLGTMLKDMALDNICHEHLTYYSLATLKQVVEECGLEIQGVESNTVNGGSIRVYITHKGKSFSSFRVGAGKKMELYGHMLSLLQEEVQDGLQFPETYVNWGGKCNLYKSVLRGYLTAMQAEGKKLYLYGASTRGSTLLQWLDLPEGTFVAAAERDEKKYGLMTVGTWVPIKSEMECHRDASIYLVLPWHFWEGIKVREKDWLLAGGKFVVPLPEPRVVTAEEEMVLVPQATATVGGGF